MIDFKDVSIYLNKNGRKLIEGLNFSINYGDKIAVIGEEGNGKSTLMKAIVDEKLLDYATIEGQINRHGCKIGYLSQFLDENWYNQLTTSYFLKDFAWEEENYDRYNEFNEIYKIAAVLNIDKQILDEERIIGSLSGGEKIKLQLLKILHKNPDVFVLDEPTNDLDIKSLEWLENFIIKVDKPIIYVSHDETLLEKTANAVLHIEQLKKKKVPKWSFQRVSYKEYIERRKLLLEREERIALKERADDYERMEKWRQVYNRVNHELNTITRQDPAGARLLKKKMKAIKSQEKRFEKEREEFTDIPDVEEAINVKFEERTRLSRQIFDVDIDQLTIGEKVLAKNLHLEMTGSKKYVIVGDNGVGKTTFLKYLYSIINNEHNVSIGYMPQNYDEYLKQYNSVLDFIESFCETKEDITRARTFLGSMKFTTEETESRIDELSGGQKAKLYILKMIMSNYDLLLLDEPTRNLSPLSNPIIRKAFKNYNGAIVAVSHDRKFIEEVFDEIYELTSTGIKKL